MSKRLENRYDVNNNDSLLAAAQNMFGNNSEKNVDEPEPNDADLADSDADGAHEPSHSDSLSSSFDFTMNVSGESDEDSAVPLVEGLSQSVQFPKFRHQIPSVLGLPFSDALKILIDYKCLNFKIVFDGEGPSGRLGRDSWPKPRAFQRCALDVDLSAHSLYLLQEAYWPVLGRSRKRL